jgi:hypothetical protein
MRPKRLAIAMTLTMFTILGVAGTPRTAQGEPPGGSNLELRKFYTGPIGHQGQFRGKLLCLCCDLTPDTGKAKTCDAQGHHHVLAIDEDGSLHPLLAGTAEVTKQINSNELHGKQVVVSGNYYPSTGVIFVSKIQVQ